MPTMLIATHEMGFARHFADEVCVLDGGHIVRRGPPAQISGDPATRRFPSRALERA